MCLSGWQDEPYFRLYHSLNTVDRTQPEGLLLKTAEQDDLELLVQLINSSYTDLSVDAAQLAGYTKTAVYAPHLWVIAYDAVTSTPVGCGIADLDRNMGEGILEWIQVLPSCRQKGVGCAIVAELLRRMQGDADFATVSGKMNSPFCPEKLYRKCGFNGHDVWHVLRAVPCTQ